MRLYCCATTHTRPTAAVDNASMNLIFPRHTGNRRDAHPNCSVVEHGAFLSFSRRSSSSRVG